MCSRERALERRPVAGRDQHRLLEHAAPLRLRSAAAGTGEHARDRVRARVDDFAVADRRARSGRTPGRPSRRARATRRRGARPSCMPEPVAQRVDVRVAGRGEAGGAGAHPNVARVRGARQVVVEGRDAVDRRLGQPRRRGRRAPILVGDLAVILHRRLEHVERRGARRRRGCGGRVRRDCATWASQYRIALGRANAPAPAASSPKRAGGRVLGPHGEASDGRPGGAWEAGACVRERSVSDRTLWTAE